MMEQEERQAMRIPIDETALPPAMARAWRVNAHAATLPVHLDAAQLVTAVFGIRPRPLAPGDVLRTQVGGFRVEACSDAPGHVLAVLLTDMPGGDARLGVEAATSTDGVAVVLYTSEHPRSWIGRIYYRLIEPFHHLLMEQVVLRRLRRRARQVAHDRR
jgi:hypothetical protein